MIRTVANTGEKWERGAIGKHGVGVGEMRILLCSLVVGVCVLTSAGSQTDRAEPDVHAQVKHQRYCRAGSRNAILLATFNIEMKNGSDSPIEIALPLYPVARVARSARDLQTRKYEAILGVPLVVEKVGSVPKARPAPVSIGAGETSRVETMEITFPVSASGETVRTDLGRGTHFAELLSMYASLKREPF